MLTSADNFAGSNKPIDSNTNPNVPPPLPRVIQEVVDNAVEGSFIVVYVRKFNCNEETPEEKEIKAKLEQHKKTFYFYTICYSIHELQFPEPATDVVYVFRPKQKWFNMVGKAQGFANYVSNMVVHIEEQEAKTKKFTISSTEQEEKQMEMLNTEDLREFPSVIQQARGLLKTTWAAAKEVAQGKPLLVPAQVAAARLATCHGCEHHVDNRCKQCGCYMEQKVNFAISTCPINKWVPVPAP